MSNKEDNNTFHGQDFGKGNMAFLVLKQAIPLSCAQLVAILYSVVDRIYIGHIQNVGMDALTGVGLCIPIVTLINALSLLFGQGGAPLFSLSRGKKDFNRAGRILGNSCFMLICASFLSMIIGYVFMKPIFYAFGATDVTYVFAKDYMNIYLLGTIFIMVSSGLNWYITALGHPKTAMITTLSGAVINLILDPLFIFYFHLGIKGAAIATVISQAVSFIWVIAFLIRAEIPLVVSMMKPVFEVCFRIVSLGLTGFIMEFTNGAIQIVCNRQLSFYGGSDYVAIMTVFNSLRAVMSVAVTGITQGAQPVLGFNYGAKNYDRVKSGIKCSSMFAFAYTIFAWVIVTIFPSFFIGMFSSDAAVNLIAVKYLRIYFFAYVFMAFQFSGQSTFMALGKAKRAIFFSVFRKVILVLPLTIILPLYMKDPIAGVFAAEPVSNVIGGLASFLTMYFTLYRKLGKEKTNLA